MKFQNSITSRFWLAFCGAGLLSGCGPGGNSTGTPGPDTPIAANRAPTAKADQVNTLTGVSTAIMALANDSDPDGDAIKLLSVSATAAGTAVIDDAGTQATADDFVLFTSNSDYVGMATLSYVIEDASGETAQANIDIDVQRRAKSAGNAAPVASSDVVDLDNTSTIDVLANDSDPDGATLAIVSWTQAANATVTINDGGTPSLSSDDTLVVTPIAGFVGQDSFVYTITDGTDTATAEVVFTTGTPPQSANNAGRVPLADAVVTVYRADAFGLPTGTALAQTVSDSAGLWQANLDATTGLLIVQARGGFFLDDSRGLAKGADAVGPQFGTGDVLETAVPAAQLYSSMTLLSNAMLLHARRDSLAVGFEQAFADSGAAFTAAFGFDPASQQLALPLLPSRNANRADHLMLLGGLANTLNASSVALSQNAVKPNVVHAVIRDISDCVLDALESTDPVLVELGGIQISLPVTERIEIASLRFRNNVADLFGSGAALSVDSSHCVQNLAPAPVFTNVPTTLNIAADSAAGTAASLAAIADALAAALAVDNTGPVTVTHDAPSIFPLGLTTVTFTATGSTGIQSSAQFDVIVSDQTPPSITPPANISVPRSTTTGLTPVVLGAATVSDNVSSIGALGVSNDAPAGGFPVGTTQVNWTVVDESGLTAQAIQLVTILANGSPEVNGSLNPVAALEGSALSADLSVVFSDPNNDPLTYSVTGLPAGSELSMDGVTGQLTGTPNNGDAAFSPITLGVIASDGILSATANVVITVTPVNDAPVVVNSLSNVTLTEDVTSSISTAQAFVDIDTPVLTYSAAGLPAALAFNTGSGIISGIPDDATVAGSPYSITISASDGEFSASTGFVLTILNVNDAPVVQNPLGTQSINQGQTFSLSLGSVFTDVDSAGITISASGLPPSITLSGFDLNGVPTNDDALAGNFGITITATDTEGATATESFLLVVQNVNDAPNVTTPIGNQSATEDVPFSLNVSGSFEDIDLDSLSFSATGLPATLGISAGGLISGSPTNADAAASPFSVIVSAADSGGLSVSDSFSLTIVNTNDAPVISSIASPAPVDEDNVIGPLSFTVSDLETSAGALTVTANSSNPALIPVGNITLGGAGPNRTITLTPVADTSGSATIDVQVSDGSATDSTSFVAVFNAVNDAPSFAPIADSVIAEDYSSPVIVDPVPGPVPNDELSQVVTYSLLPATASFVQVNLNTSTGRITFTSLPDENGTQTFVLTANDGQSVNNTFSRSFDFTVTAVQDPPVAQNDFYSSPQDTPQTHYVLTNDSDVEGDTLQLVSAGPATAAGGTVSVNDAGTPADFTDDFIDYVPASGYSGFDQYSYTISDGGQIDSAFAFINVTPPVDTDGDGIVDPIENALAVSTHPCLSPTDPDSDNDGLSDGLEVAAGSDPCFDAGTQTVVRIDAAGPSTEWPGAVTTIPATLTEGTAGAPTILMVASGTYSQSFVYTNVCDNVVFLGSLDATSSSFEPVLDADNAPTTVIDLNGGNNADLDNCTNIEINNVRFTNGLGTTFGGGQEGGAFHIGGTSTVTLDGAWLTDSSVDVQGGGLAVSNSSVATVRNSQIQNNVVTSGKGGGGIWVGNNAELILENSIVINNRADGNGGGGLAFDPGSKGTVIDSVISGNKAGNNYGGGIFAIGFGTQVTVNNTLINGNRAAMHGGGFYVFQTPVEINNVLVTGNYAGDSGGGLYLDLTLGSTINNATVVYNQSGVSGAGIGADLDPPVIRDSIVFQNRALDRILGSPVMNSDTFTNAAEVDSDYNLVESDEDGPFDINLTSFGKNPEFRSGFYLDQSLSDAVDTGSRNVIGSVVEYLTTNINGDADLGMVDRGYHYQEEAEGPAVGIEQIYPVGNYSVSSGDPAEVVFRLLDTDGETLSQGHEVIGAVTAAPIGFDWDTATSLEPAGVLSSFADDLGNGAYRLPMNLGALAPFTVTFDVLVDGAIVDSISINIVL